MSDLTPLFTGDMDLLTIRKADCPNNPRFVEGSKDYAFNKEGKFVDSIWVQMNTKKGPHVLEYRHCTFINGNSDAVLYERSVEHGVRVAIVRSTSKPYAVSKGIFVFRPKDGVDANTLAALLRLPIVYRQLIAYEQYGIGFHLNDILVPTDKRVIGDELFRMKKEETVTNELGDKVQAMKTEYINEVRMRKHDMGQKVFDLINTEDLMRYYVENREIESDVWFQIEEQLNHFRSTIHELSEMLDHLSQEEQFGNPELLDLNDYLANLQHSNNVNGFTLSYQLDRDSILDLQLSHMKERGIKDMNTVMARPTVFMAKNDLQRVVSNILSNAQIHGFVDPNRMDYEVNIRLEFNADKGMYQIDFRNNGKPLPDGMNKMRYGIKGEKAGQTAGTGLGGSIVKSIVEHYKGDYNVFMDGDWTVIRVYLPIAI
jgi:signal transduction histidine kinase